MAGSVQPGLDMVNIDEDDFDRLKQEFIQEHAEAAMRDCIKHWHRVHLQTSMELKGIYDSLLTVGFDPNQALVLTLGQLQNSK
jgi:hypothetical protein